MRLPSDLFVEGVEARPVEVEILTKLCQLKQTTTQLTKEVQRMANQDAALTQVVSDLAAAFTDNANAVAAEIQAIKNSITLGDDPVVDNAVSALQALVVTMQNNTAAAQAAIAPPAPASPTPADSAPAATGDETGTTGTEAAQ